MSTKYSEGVELVGKNLGHYEILRSLGKGGMGEVYLARDTKLGRQVALKLMPEDLKDDPDRRARFTREAQSIAVLNHPNVVTIHAVEEADGRPFLVMEYVEGPTLDREVPVGGLPVDRFFDLALSLTEAVGAAHAKGITHRDLKPQNVMIDVEGRLKVLDFGLAKLLEAPAAADDLTIADDGHATREGVILGTAAYMSPEQAEGKPVDARSDVFSLGILLYQMITGRQPFQGDTQMSTLTAVMRDDPQPVMEIRPGLPRQMARIIRRCLEKDPARRYEAARGIHYDLEILREEVDSGEHEAPAVSRQHSSPGGGFRPAPWMIAAVIVVIAAVGIFWMKPWLETATSESGDSVKVTSAVELPTIVVFPFENMGPPEDAYFAAGITDDIVTSLTGVEGIRVVSRTSSLQYDRAGKTMKQIADDLGVDYVLAGSVRWQKGDHVSRVRVAPQLMDANTDEQVWAVTYDRDMEEIFRVQSEIAGEVVQSLGVTLTGAGSTPAEPDIPTHDMTGYHAYLKAREIIDTSRFEGSSWYLAVDLLNKAVDRDPEFLEAWAKLSEAHAGMCHFDWDRTEARLAMSKAAADRALALAPNSYRAHYALGRYYYWGLKDFDRALEAFRRVEELHPGDVRNLESVAWVLRRLNRFEEATDMLVRAAELSPRDASLCIHIAETMGITGEYEEADTWSLKAMAVGPDLALNFLMAGWVAVQADQSDKARTYIADAPHFSDVELHNMQFRIFFYLRDYAAALADAEKIDDVYETQFIVASRWLARGMTHLAMGRADVSREDFSRAESVLSAKLIEKPDAGNLVAGRAVALAGMGRGEEALAEIQRCFDMFPVNKDPWIRTWREFDLAYVQTLAGRPEDAVRTLEALMEKQTDVISPAILRTTPQFDSLREREDFQRLVARYP